MQSLSVPCPLCHKVLKKRSFSLPSPPRVHLCVNRETLDLGLEEAPPPYSITFFPAGKQMYQESRREDLRWSPVWEAKAGILPCLSVLSLWALTADRDVVS